MLMYNQVNKLTHNEVQTGKKKRKKKYQLPTHTKTIQKKSGCVRANEYYLISNITNSMRKIHSKTGGTASVQKRNPNTGNKM